MRDGFPIAMLRFQHPYLNLNNPTSLLERFRAALQPCDKWDCRASSQEFLPLREVLQQFQEVVQSQLWRFHVRYQRALPAYQAQLQRLDHLRPWSSKRYRSQ